MLIIDGNAVYEMDEECMRKHHISRQQLYNGEEAEVSKLLLDVFKGKKLSEINETDDNINKLQVVNSSLNDLKIKARI